MDGVSSLDNKVLWNQTKPRAEQAQGREAGLELVSALSELLVSWSSVSQLHGGIAQPQAGDKGRASSGGPIVG